MHPSTANLPRPKNYKMEEEKTKKYTNPQNAHHSSLATRSRFEFDLNRLSNKSMNGGGLYSMIDDRYINRWMARPSRRRN